MRAIAIVILLCAGSVFATPRWDACTESAQCQVVPRTCCGSCGAPTEKDAIAVNAEVEERPPCEGGSGCPDCADDNPHQMVAVCEKKTCKVLYLDRSPLTSCKRDSDCATRPVGCCGGGAVAVRKDRLEALTERMGCNGVGCDRAMRPALPRAVCRAARCAVPDQNTK
jgi:hypothetical protein